MKKVRKPWISFIFSLLCPGLGHLYNGKLLPVLIAFIIGAILTIFTTLYFLGNLTNLLLALSAGILFDFAFALHSFYQAKKLPVLELKRFQRWWVYVIYAVVLYGIPDGYGFLMPTRLKSFQIPSESMVPNLLIGDRLVADGWAYWGKRPKRGDIVVFKYPKDQTIFFVKRLIGLPGDKVQFKKGELYLNDVLVPQVRTSTPSENNGPWSFVQFTENLEGKEYTVQRAQPMVNNDFGPINVPENSFFMVGDNRDRSSDGRVWGFVDSSLIVAQMNFIFFSYDEKSGQIRWDRIGKHVF
ncbi:MAG: signal peptidase I [Oligoflexia bacterium]|nr:signal peptidase I [Oligoflexia bacterium]